MRHWISSWDDGGEGDVKIAELLRKYDLPGIFFIPSRNLLSVDEVRALAREFEVGGHTFSHPQDLKLLDDERLVYEVFENKRWLEEVAGRPVDWFCYPRGRHDERVRNVVRTAGYLYARTTVVGNTELPPDHYRVPTTIHVYPRKEYGGEPWLDLAKRMAKAAAEDGGYFHLWGHSAEITKLREWVNLERFFHFVREYGYAPRASEGYGQRD